MGLYYAQLDEDSKVNGISESPAEIKQANMIPIESYDESLLRQIYDAETKTFSPDPTPEPPAPEKTVSQQILEKVVSLEAKVDAISAASAASAGEVIKAG